MENRQRRTYTTFRRILVFLDGHPLQPEPPLLAKMRTSLAASVTRIAELGGDQNFGDRSARASSSELQAMKRHMRRERMMALKRLMKPLLKFAPGAERLKVPHARTDTLTLAAEAQKMAKILAPHTKLLVSAGYSKTFLKEFREEAKALADAANLSHRARQRRARATLAIARELKKGMESVTVIEGILMPRLERDRALAHVWRMTRRVPARTGRPRERSKSARGLMGLAGPADGGGPPSERK